MVYPAKDNNSARRAFRWTKLSIKIELKQTFSDMQVNNKVNYCKSIKSHNEFALFFIVGEVVMQDNLLK